MRIALLLCAAALAGCAVRPGTASAPSAEGLRCVSAAGISGRYVMPPDSILFEMVGRVSYRNRLAARCSGLERLGQSAGILLEHSAGGLICAGDPVRLFDSRDTGPNRLAGAPTCRLGTFTAVPRR